MRQKQEEQNLKPGFDYVVVVKKQRMEKCIRTYVPFDSQ